jgi:microcystin-dependent protein
MTGPTGDVVPGFSAVDTTANVSATGDLGSGSPVSRAVLNTTSMRELAEAMTEPPDPGAVNRRWGIVAAYSGPPDYTVDVTVGGVLIPGLAYDAAYTPTVGEVVMLDVVGTDTVVIGTTAPGQWRTGQLEPTFLPAPKAGSLICTGQAISRTTYANLWSWVTAHSLAGTGKPFGNGDGSTTFTLPDLRGLVPIGAGTLGADTYNIGDRPGAARQTLATNQMPAHSHAPSGTATTTVTGAAHSHAFSDTSTSTGSHTHGGGTDNQGSHTHQLFGGEGGGWVLESGTGSYGGTDPSGQHFGPWFGGGFSAVNNVVTNAAGGHTHSYTTASAGGHTHDVSGTTGSTTSTATAATSVTVTEATIGGSTPIDVRQPAFVVNWLIYV